MFNFSSAAGSLCSQLGNGTLTSEEDALLRKQLSNLARKRAIVLKQNGTWPNWLDIESTYAEQAEIVGGYTQGYDKEDDKQALPPARWITRN